MAKLYGWLAGLLAVFAVVGVIYGKGRLDAKHTNEVRQLTETIELAQKMLDTERDARRSDAVLAAEQARQRAALTLQIDGLNEYVETLEDRNRECLSGADVERLRNLWR